MATKFLTNLDLSTNQILNGRFEVLTEDPTTNLFEGRMYYNSTYDIIRYYTGGAWKLLVNNVVAGGSYSAAITVNEASGQITITPNLATSSAAGVMSATDKAKLDNATADATSSTLVLRDVNGQSKFGTPTDPSHAATKAYVDAARSGLDVKQSVKLATNTALPTFTHLDGVLTGTTIGALSIDGATPLAGNRILVKNETSTNSPFNGIYDVTNPGSVSEAFVLTRSSDANDNTEVTPGLFVFVEQGDNWADSGWVLTTDGTINVGTTNLTFVQFSSAGQSIAGDGLTKSGNKIDVVGTTDRISVTSDSVDIAATYAGQTSITTLGTVTTGTWNGTDIAVADGGTGASTAADARTNLAAGGTQGAGVSVPVISRTVAATIGDGASLTYVIQHGLGTRDVTVQVYQVSGATPTYETVTTDVTRTDTNNVTIGFSSAPSSNSYRVVITG